MKDQENHPTFAEKLQLLQAARKSLLCIGIDPEYEKIPRRFAGEKDWLFKFCHVMIKSTMQYAVAYKFNFAFFEAHGTYGWETLARLREVVPTDCLTLADAKRGDIGNSARQYAKAVFEQLGFDAVTVNPYMGHDAVQPFLDYEQKGAFLLCLTSNPGAKDFQYCQCGDAPLYLHVAKTAKAWDTHKNCGLVVGGTKAAQLKKVREV